MLLEAQRKLQDSGGRVDIRTPRSTASVAVETGARVRTGALYSTGSSAQLDVTFACFLFLSWF